MVSARRSITVLVALALVAGLAAGFGVLRAWRDGGLPWGFSLPWQRMEALLETQVITETVVDVRVSPPELRVDGAATLTIKQPGAGGQVVLLLNQGLKVNEVRCDGVPVKWRRHAERILAQLPEGTTACALTVAYGGVMRRANRTLTIGGPDLLMADGLQWWYPLDLKNFPALTGRVRVPDGMQVAWGGNSVEGPVADGYREFAWTEARPMLYAGIAVGRFERLSRLQGGVRCNIYGQEITPADADAWFSALGDAYNYLQSLLGTDGFPHVNLVITRDMHGIAHLGGALIAANPDALADPDRVFVDLARQVARNWWGDTVSGRWFTSRPEAGEWLMSGLSEYCAWQALRNVKGRRAYLRYMEQLHYPDELSVAEKTINLDHRLLDHATFDERALVVRGPYAAAAIASYIGEPAFQRACRNFMAVHRYSTVSYAALLHEMTLAAEKPLDELVRVWFDRPGTFDYGIASVSAEGGRVHVTIENQGDIPAYMPIEVGVVTATGYQVQSINPGAHGDAFSFAADGPVDRVVLDPEFTLGDMHRANNVWPRTQWPAALDLAQNGRIAMLARDEWGDSGGRAIYIFSLVDKAAGNAVAVRGNGVEFHWHPEGQRLAVLGDRNGIWEDGRWTPAPPGAIFLGWSGRDPLFWRDGAISVGGVPASEPLPVPLPQPAHGLAAVHPANGAVAYVTKEEVLVIWDPKSRTLKPVREAMRAAGGVRWKGDSNTLVFFERDGALSALNSETGETQTLIQRNYAIHQSRISAAGAHAAWVDPAGLLRACTIGQGDPSYISLPGEVVDFAWEGDDALIAIVATVPRRLPMRFHAEYTLWRIPVTTWSGVQLPYDPEQFVAALQNITVLEPF